MDELMRNITEDKLKLLSMRECADVALVMMEMTSDLSSVIASFEPGFDGAGREFSKWFRVDGSATSGAELVAILKPTQRLIDFVSAFSA